MRATYKHTSIVARDWRALAGFYQDVFGCVSATPIGARAIAARRVGAAENRQSAHVPEVWRGTMSTT
jgi:predicted enzyme related to lactoylglutathione lyase